MVALSGCAVPVVTSPSVMVVPQSAESFGRYQTADGYWRHVAYAQVTASRGIQTASQNGTDTALLGGA